MNNAAFVLAHFSDQEKLLPAAARISKEKSISYWHAVDGHVHLVAWSVDPEAARESIASLDGVDKVTVYETTESGRPSEAMDPSQCFAYVFIEAEAAKRKSVEKVLAEMTEVVSYTPTRRGCDIVALIGGETFSAVDTAIDGLIRPLDGVLRIKVNRIIDLRQL